MEWYDILLEVKNETGSKKKTVLEKYKNNETLKDVLVFLYSPRITTGISIKKLTKHKNNKDLENLDIDKINNIKELMEYLKNNNTGKDKDVLSCIAYLNSIEDKLEHETTWFLIQKDLPIGISAATINKVFPFLVDDFKLMKGKAYKGEEINSEFTLTLKLDGNSATVFNLEDETYILSRSGAKILGLEYIENYYRSNIPLGYVYCGELLLKNYDKLDHGPLFQKTNGIVNSKKEDKSGLQHVVFDMVPYSEYKSKKFSENFTERRNNLVNSINKEYLYNDKYFLDVEYVTEYYVGNDFEKINHYASIVDDQNLEGLMLNINNAKYKFGPSNNLLKIKEFYTMDLLVVSLKEHIRGNMVGAIEVDYKGYSVFVSGIKDEDRKSWWKNPSEIIGKIVEIKYFRETQDKHGNLSLRFPSVVRIRDDKTFDDISYE